MLFFKKNRRCAIPVFQKFNNLDAKLRATGADTLVLNDVGYYSTDDRNHIEYALMTVYNGDTMSMAPACDCGALTGGYRIGVTCKKCGSRVSDPHERIDPVIWFRKLDGMEKFMSPHTWLMLRSIMHNRIDCMRWLSDTSYNPPNKVPSWLITMSKTLPNFERSYNYMLAHIDDILNFMLNNSAIKTTNKVETIQALQHLLHTRKEALFSDMLPLVNKKLFVVEKTAKGKFTDVSLTNLMNIVLTFVKAANTPAISDVQKSNVTARVISMLADLYKWIAASNLAGKYGAFRKHVYGGRSHFTFRAVIISIAGPHEYNEIHAPWSIGVTAYRPFLLNILVNKWNMSYKKASQLLFYATSNYVQIVDNALEALIKESKAGKLPVIIHRNPTQHQGSALLVWITKFKRDVNDITISLSNLVAKLPNADFDGDEMSCTILYDNMMTEMASVLDPIYSVPSQDSVGEISGLVSLPKTTVATLANYLSKNDTESFMNLDIASVRIEK